MKKTYNRQIGINSIFSVAKLLLTTILYFGFYKYIIGTLGIDALGFWSLVLAFSMLINIGGNGVGTGLVKYGAELHYQNKIGTLSAVSNNMFVFFLVIAALAGSSLILASDWIFDFVLEDPEYRLKYNFDFMFKVLLLSSTINMLGKSVFSLIDSINLSYLHSIFHFLGSLLFVLLGLIYLKSFGLIALAYSHLLFSAFYLVSALLIVKIKIPNFQFFYFRWEDKLMREILVYNLNFQVSGIFQVLLDPLNKFLFSKYGGLDFTACYEMANKVVFSARAVSVSVLNNIIPKLSRDNLKLNSRQILNKNYTLLNKFNIYFTLGSVFCLQFTGWIFSYIFFDELNSKFLFIFSILSLTWFINSLSAPVFFMNLGSGKLKANTYAVIIQSVVNLFFGLVLGSLFKSELIIFSIFFGLSAGSLFLINRYHKSNQIEFNFKRSDLVLLLIGIGLSIFNISIESPIVSVLGFGVFITALAILQKKDLHEFYNKLKQTK